MKKYFFVLILVLLSLTFLACQLHKSPKAPTDFVQFYMGNPYLMIKNTAAEPYFDGKVFDLGNEFKLTSQINFESEVKRKNNLTADDIGPSSMVGGLYDLTVENEDGLTYTLNPVSAERVELVNPKNRIKIIFAKTRLGQWYLSDIQNKNGIHSRQFIIKPIHVSVSEDKSNISFLNSFANRTNPNDFGLFTFYFQIGPAINLKTKAEANKSMSRYVYIRPYAPRWNVKKTVEVQICSDFAPEIQSEIHASLKEWYNVLDRRLDINITTPKVPKPFSDLNSHCINAIDGYLQNTNPRHQTLGYTLVALNHNTNHIVDSDILILTKEFAKKGVAFEDPRNTNIRNLVFIHELGHLLGLDHQFDGTESIMSYDYKLGPRVYRYDIEAIQHLYPQIK
jgi:hypothetical protein